MGKRKQRSNEGELARSKRPRVVHEAPTSEPINTARQLMQLLSFDQDLSKARHGLQSFKVFLDGLNESETKDLGQLAILKEFMESQQPRIRVDDDEAIWLPDIMDTWSLAVQANNDNIISAAPVVLALLVKIISQILDLSAHGLGICRTLLQKRQQELIARNLVSEKNKEFIISPTLRLLREVLCFDGGVLAKQVFRARSLTFKALARNMGIVFLGDGLENIKRPSARTNAVRFFMSSLKFLHSEAKTDLLSQKELVVALTRTIKDDPPYLVLEILDGLQKAVLADRKIPRGAKSKLLNPAALHRIASLYSYRHEAAEDATATPVTDAAHKFLMHVCTTQSAGILKDSGLYPKGVDPDANTTSEAENAEANSDDDDDDLGRIPWFDQFNEEIPINNPILSDFIHQLRPWSNIRHSELLIAIFEAAPELVAWYYRDKISFSFEPKLSATWIGYAALIFKSVQLDIPTFFGHKLAYARAPPPTSILLDTIIPPPLTQKVLTRCLTQKSTLISFFAMRLLVVSMEKLRQALELHREASGKNPALWKESAARLLDEFSQRCPSVKDIMNAYRAIPEDDLLYREASAKALRLYHEVIPQVAFAAKVDISPLLTASLKSLTIKDKPAGEDHALRMIELENLIAIGSSSIGVRWFSKPDNKALTMSPFMSLLAICVQPDELSISGLKESLSSIAVDQQLVASKTGLAVLLNALKQLHADEPLGSEHHVWTFLDNCASRCTSSLVKYVEMLEELKLEVADSSDESEPARSLSLLTMTMAEQLPHAITGTKDHTLTSLASFMSLYIEYSAASEGESSHLLSPLRTKIIAMFPKKSKARATFGKKPELRFALTTSEEASPTQVNGDTSPSKPPKTMDQATLQTLLATSFPTENPSAVSKWTTKSVDELIDEGHLSSLILLLSSTHTSIRKEALTNIRKAAAKIRASSYDEKDQIWLLLSELAESAKQHPSSEPLPAHITSFAFHALDVLKNPLHALYDKLNTFLTSGPVWHLDKIPLAHDILRNEPTNPDAYYSELSWLLSYLLDSLRTPEALTLFHNKRLFEKVLGLSGNPHMRRPLRMLVLRIVYRASEIEGGSATLITRFGVLSWLKGQGEGYGSAAVGGDDDERDVFEALRRRLVETSDSERIKEWIGVAEEEGDVGMGGV